MQSNINNTNTTLNNKLTQWYCYFCKQSMQRTSKYCHLNSITHKKNTELLRYEPITNLDLSLLIQTQGMSSYDIYKKYGNQVDRKIRELKKKINNYK